MTTLKRATIKSYAAGTHRASIQVTGSLSVWLDNIPVAANIPHAAVVAGRECAVLFFTDDNPEDAVVITIHGVLPSPTWQDSAANPRITLSTVTPHVTLTGDVAIPAGTVNIGNAAVGGRLTVGNNVALTANQELFRANLTCGLGAAVTTITGVGSIGTVNPQGFVLTNIFGLNFTPSVTGLSGGSVTNLTAVRSAPGLVINAIFTTLRHFHAVRAPSYTVGAGTTIMGLDVDNLGHGAIAATIGIRIADQLASAAAYHAQFLGPTVDLLRFVSGNPPDAALATEGDSGLFLGWMENGVMNLRRTRSKTLATLAAGDRVLIAV